MVRCRHESLLSVQEITIASNNNNYVQLVKREFKNSIEKILNLYANVSIGYLQ